MKIMKNLSGINKSFYEELLLQRDLMMYLTLFTSKHFSNKKNQASSFFCKCDTDLEQLS